MIRFDWKLRNGKLGTSQGGHKKLHLKLDTCMLMVKFSSSFLLPGFSLTVNNGWTAAIVLYKEKSNLVFLSLATLVRRCPIWQRVTQKQKKDNKFDTTQFLRSDFPRWTSEKRGKFISAPIIDFPHSKHFTEIIDSDANINNHQAFQSGRRSLCNFQARLHALKFHSILINLWEIISVSEADPFRVFVHNKWIVNWMEQILSHKSSVEKIIHHKELLEMKQKKRKKPTLYFETKTKFF